MRNYELGIMNEEPLGIKPLALSVHLNKKSRAIMSGFLYVSFRLNTNICSLISAIYSLKSLII